MDQPRYLQVADHYRRLIRSGQLLPGTRLPARHEIAAEHHVAEGVARKAIQVLASEGLVEVRSGAGAFVRKQPELRRLVRSWYRDHRGGSPFRAEMEAQGRSGTWSYESLTVQAPPPIRERLALPKPVDELPDVMRTRYVFFGDDEPVMLSTSYEPYALTRGTPIVFPEDGPHAGLGVVDRMAVIGVTITHCSEIVSARPITAAEAKDLAMQAGALALTVERTYYADTRAVETADLVVPVDKYRLVYGIPVHPS